jgi:transcriptional regulator with PAS, ATPase and Fis domain
MTREGTFRPDLLYRINTVEIRLPPLRERAEDIPELARYFLDLYARKYNRTAKRIDTSAMEKLIAYPWPGNVRELHHALERAVIMSDHERLQPSDFFFASAESTAVSDEDMTFGSYNLDDVEKMVIRRTLARHQGNISRAARELGLTRTSLYRRMEKYGL